MGKAALVARFLLLLSMACVVGCKKQSTTCQVEGQVFIRQRNGETLKLSLVPVLLYTSNTFAAHVANQLTRHRKAIAELDVRIEEANDQKNKFIDERQPLLEQARQAESELAALETDVKARALDFNRNAHNWSAPRMKAYKEAVAALNERRKLAQAKVDSIRSKISSIQYAINKSEADLRAAAG